MVEYSCAPTNAWASDDEIWVSSGNIGTRRTADAPALCAISSLTIFRTFCHTSCTLDQFLSRARLRASSIRLQCGKVRRRAHTYWEESYHNRFECVYPKLLSYWTLHLRINGAIEMTFEHFSMSAVVWITAFIALISLMGWLQMYSKWRYKKICSIT